MAPVVDRPRNESVTVQSAKPDQTLILGPACRHCFADRVPILLHLASRRGLLPFCRAGFFASIFPVSIF